MALVVQGDGVRRIGTFELTDKILAECPEEVMKLFGSMVIVRAEAMFSSGSIQYVAYCDQFDEIHTVGFHLPRYLVQLDPDTKTWEFIRSDYKGDIPPLKRVSSFAPKVRTE